MERSTELQDRVLDGFEAFSSRDTSVVDRDTSLSVRRRHGRLGLRSRHMDLGGWRRDPHPLDGRLSSRRRGVEDGAGAHIRGCAQ